MLQVPSIHDFNALVERVERLEKENASLRRGLSAWVKQHEAQRLGFSRSALYEMRQDGRLQLGVDYKYEGKAVYFNRTSLENLNEGQRPRRRKLPDPLKQAS